MASPVFMGDEQRERFIDFMRKTFGDIEVLEVEEASRPGPHGGEQRKWSVDDIAMLMSGGSIEEKANKLNRSEMSVIMRTGSVVPDIAKWMKKKGYMKFPPAKEIVEEFMKEVGML